MWQQTPLFRVKALPPLYASGRGTCDVSTRDAHPVEGHAAEHTYLHCAISDSQHIMVQSSAVTLLVIVIHPTTVEVKILGTGIDGDGEWTMSPELLMKHETVARLQAIMIADEAGGEGGKLSLLDTCPTENCEPHASGLPLMWHASSVSLLLIRGSLLLLRKHGSAWEKNTARQGPSNTMHIPFMSCLYILHAPSNPPPPPLITHPPRDPCHPGTYNPHHFSTQAWNKKCKRLMDCQ